MPTLNPEENNTRLKLLSFGDMELKYVSGGDIHKYFYIFEQKKIGDKEFVQKVLYNQLIKPKLNWKEFLKISDNELRGIAKAFIKNEKYLFENFKDTGDLYNDFRITLESCLVEHLKSLEPMKKKAEETYKRVSDTLRSIAQKFPKIEIPSPRSAYFKEKYKYIKPSIIIQEENNWKRHNRLLDTLYASLKIQDGILGQQKSTAKLTKWILGLAVVGIIIALVSLLVTILSN